MMRLIRIKPCPSEVGRRLPFVAPVLTDAEHLAVVVRVGPAIHERDLVVQLEAVRVCSESTAASTEAVGLSPQPQTPVL